MEIVLTYTFNVPMKGLDHGVGIDIYLRIGYLKII